MIGGAFASRVTGSSVEVVGQNKQEIVGGARVLMVNGAHVEHVGGNRTLRSGETRFSSAGALSVAGANIELQAGGALTHEVTGNLGITGSEVTVRGSSELRARAGGAELVLGGSVLDVDASLFSSSGSMVRLLGQIEMISGDSADQAEPEQPGPEDDWIEIRLLDGSGRGHGGQRYLARLADGSERSGRLDPNGKVRLTGIVPGTVHVSFPDAEEA